MALVVEQPSHWAEDPFDSWDRFSPSKQGQIFTHPWLHLQKNLRQASGAQTLQTLQMIRMNWTLQTYLTVKKRMIDIQLKGEDLELELTLLNGSEEFDFFEKCFL